MFYLSTSILFSIVAFCIVSSLNGLYIILMKKDHFLPNLEENMPWEDMLQDNKDASHASYAQLHVQPELSQLRASHDQMDRGGQLGMILTWQNAFIADIVKKLVQSMPSWKDQIMRMQQLHMNSYFTTNKNY